MFWVVSMQSNWPRLNAPVVSGLARATRCAVPVMGPIRRSNHALGTPERSPFCLSRGSP